MLMREVADELGVHPTTLRGWALRGQMRGERLRSFGGRITWHFEPSEVERVRREMVGAHSDNP